jgi:glucose/arabinose dehydrogenase
MTNRRAAVPLLALAVALAACQPGPRTQAEEPTAAPDAVQPSPTRVPPPPPTPQATPQAKPTPEKEPQARIPEGPDMRPVPVPTSEQPCRDQIGQAAATALVERCRMVSPATRPPCNAANPCDLIQNEIDRSCALWARDGNPPAECAA